MSVDGDVFPMTRRSKPVVMLIRVPDDLMILYVPCVLCLCLRNYSSVRVNSPNHLPNDVYWKRKNKVVYTTVFLCACLDLSAAE